MGNPFTDTPSSPLVTGQGHTTQRGHCLHLFCTTTASVRSKDAALKTRPQRAFNWLASSVAPLMDRTKHTYSGHPLQTMPCEDYKAKARSPPPTSHRCGSVVIREHVPRLLCFIFCGRRRKPFNLHSDSKWIFYCFGELDGRGLCAVPPTKKPRRHNGRLCTDERRLTWPLPTTHKQDISWMSNNIMHTQSVFNTSSSSHIPNSNCKGTQDPPPRRVDVVLVVAGTGICRPARMSGLKCFVAGKN